jgi:thymidine kinase
MFPGSARLFELADSVSELKTVCTCGGKAMVNARIDGEGNIITEGAQIMLGGNESYRPMCYKCWKKAQQKAEEV